MPPLDDAPDPDVLPVLPELQLLPQPAARAATTTIATATPDARFQLFLICTGLSPLIRKIDICVCAERTHNGRGLQVAEAEALHVERNLHIQFWNRNQRTPWHRDVDRPMWPSSRTDTGQYLPLDTKSTDRTGSAQEFWIRCQGTRSVRVASQSRGANRYL